MSCRTSQILALTILVPATISGSPGHAQENFKLLGEKEIGARVVGNDITDSSHWVSYLRPDGVCICITIVPPNDFIRKIHDRMRAFIEAKAHARWFDGANDRLEQSENPGPVPVRARISRSLSSGGASRRPVGSIWATILELR